MLKELNILYIFSLHSLIMSSIVMFTLVVFVTILFTFLPLPSCVMFAPPVFTTYGLFAMPHFTLPLSQSFIVLLTHGSLSGFLPLSVTGNNNYCLSSAAISINYSLSYLLAALPHTELIWLVHYIARCLTENKVIRSYY